MSFASPADAQDAIDNMDLNELKGRVLKVNLARQVKAPVQGAGNRASTLPRMLCGLNYSLGPYYSLGVRGMASTKCKTSWP